MSEHVKYPSNILTIVIRDDTPMILCNDHPSYRSVRIKLTDEQVKQLGLHMTGECGKMKYFETISQCFIEPSDGEANRDDVV